MSAFGGMCNAMKSWVPLATAAVMSGLLAACAAPLLAPDDRKNVCHVAVEEKFGSPTFHANVFSGSAGGLAGAGAGALAGLQGGVGAIFTVPLGAVIGAAGGTACAAAESDSIIEIEKIDAGMKCLFGQQEYWIAVQWRTLEARTRRQLNWTTTRYAQTTLRTVDDWFANPDQAATEIEGVLTIVGRQMAAQLLSGNAMNRTSLH